MTDRISGRPSTPRNATADYSPAGRMPAEMQQAEREFESLMAKKKQKSPDEKKAASESRRKEEDVDGEEELESQSLTGLLKTKKDADQYGGSGQTLPSPDDILRSLTSSESAAPVHEVSKDLNAIVGQVADEVLVSEASGQREVRITLKEAVLPDTEVRLVQENGMLQVRLVSDNPESRQKISMFQNSLQTVLGERLPDRQVAVSLDSSTSSFGGDPQGQSRGYGQEAEPDEDE